MDLNGVVFLSQILSFNNSADGSTANPGTENAFYLALPSFAATAWYHHKLANQPATLEPWLHEVEQFSLGEYASALLQGSDLSAEKKAAVAAKLEAYTGIPARTWIKADLRLTGGQFSELVQEADGLTTGRLDSRYQGPQIDPLGEESGYDPFFQAIGAAYLTGINEYAHNDLKFGDNLTYKPSAHEPGWNWELRHRVPGAGWPEGSVNVMTDLASTLKLNTRDARVADGRVL